MIKINTTWCSFSTRGPLPASSFGTGSSYFTLTKHEHWRKPRGSSHEQFYRSVRICTWKSSKLGSGRKAYFFVKLRRLFVLSLSRPESNLELVPSWDQDDLVAKNKGRQRASKSRLNFHISGPHIQCIWWWYNRYQWYWSDGSWMSHTDRKRDYESFSRW